MEEVKRKVFEAKNFTAYSMIEYAKQELGAKDIYELRTPEYIRGFLELILDEQVMNTFAYEQYIYAVTLLLGHRVLFEDKGEAVEFLRVVKKEYNKLNEFNSVIGSIDEKEKYYA